MKQQIRVTVRPPAGFFIIYMRAINDLAWCRSDWLNNDEYQHSLMLDEQAYDGKSTNNNWRAGWYEEGNNVGEAKWGEDYSPHNGYHYVYIYTQIGETASGSTSETRNTAEWYFGGKTDYQTYKRNTVSQGWLACVSSAASLFSKSGCNEPPSESAPAALTLASLSAIQFL